MEESEKRRERLKAMRVQADKAEVSSSNEGSAVPGCLSNPLIETSPSIPLWGEPGATPRFDFYTDPMSAFSGNKKMSNASSQIAPNYYSPPNFGGPPVQRFTSPHPEFINPQMTSPPRQFYQAPNRSPTWNLSRGPAGYNRPYYPSIPGFGPPGSAITSTGQGMPHWTNHSPNHFSEHRSSPIPSPGRGRGSWFNNGKGPGSCWSGGRGHGSHGHPSVVDRPRGPRQFYQKSMVEDPWKFMTPVIWKGINVPSNTPESSKSLISESFSTKKAKVSDASDRSSSQPSLAEYLAASFNEAVNDTENG